MIVDDMHQEYPELLKDIHFNQGGPTILPYTQEAAHLRMQEPKGSAEIKEEADNASSTYYRLSYPFHRTASKQKSMMKNSSSMIQLDSEYESIDHNALFGKMKAKIRRSQMRKAGGMKSEDDTNSIYSPPVAGGHHHHAGRRLSVDRAIKGRMSQRSIYSKMLSNRFWKSMRRSGRMTRPVQDDKERGMTDKEDKEAIGQNQRRKKSSASSINSRNLYGRLASLEMREEGDGDDQDMDLMARKLRSQLPHLYDITEQNSPNSTHGHSRHGSRPMLITDETFVPPTIKEMPTKTNSEQESNAYYPLGSDGSSQRPTSPRFHVEEVPNYEPILISKMAAINSSPPKMRKVVGPSNSSPASLAKTVVKREMKKKLTSSSPVLPRRQPVFHPLENGGPKTPDINPLMMQPEIVITAASSDNENVSPAFSIGSSGESLPDNMSTSSEELSIEKRSESPAKDINDNDNDGSDANSAFDSATFYV